MDAKVKQKNTKNQNKNKHIPVLMQAVLDALNPQKGERYLDLTAGYGGHARAVITATGAPQQATLVDRDAQAVQTLEQTFAGQGVRLIHSDFAGACQELAAAGEQFDLILADLGVSSPHLDTASRGFSFMAEGPLDMRMDQTQALQAATIINEWSLEQLRDILRRFGEEPRAQRFASAIVEHRPLQTTIELAHVIERAAYGKRDKKGHHPATRTFQAIRMAVNNELQQLEQALQNTVRLLAPGGRIAIISFHSLEDRLVKQFLSDMAGNRYDAPFTLLTKKPITAPPDELVSNPRARSAKLRAAVKK